MTFNLKSIEIAENKGSCQILDSLVCVHEDRAKSTTRLARERFRTEAYLRHPIIVVELHVLVLFGPPIPSEKQRRTCAWVGSG